MQSIGIFEVKTKLSEIVRKGETVIITNHRQPVAKIVPLVIDTPELAAKFNQWAAGVKESDLTEEWAIGDEWGDSCGYAD